jgi:hypothetical protein
VNGVASGLRSSPWNTTPAEASIDPTRAPASVRGRRATKKICASTFSPNGTAGSNARRRLIRVDPMSGAIRIAATASIPKAASVITSRRPIRRVMRRFHPARV